MVPANPPPTYGMVGGTAVATQPIPVILWAAKSLSVWEKAVSETIKREKDAHKPSQYVEAIEKPVHDIALTLDDCPLLYPDHMKAIEDKDGSKRRASLKDLQQSLEDAADSLKIKLPHLLAALPVIFSAIRCIASGDKVSGVLQVLQLIFQSFTPITPG